MKINRGALLRAVEQPYFRQDLPEFRVGDTVRTTYRVVEGNRERLQSYEGVVLRIQHNGLHSSFTVRRISYGEGVERTFPFNSPLIGRVEVVSRGKVRRAKLYYLRELHGKAARIKPDRKRTNRDATAAKPVAASSNQE
jgi:large subunit ribosomal protein L19